MCFWQTQVWYHDDEHDRIAIDSPLDFEAALNYAAQLDTRDHPHLNIYVLGMYVWLFLEDDISFLQNHNTPFLQGAVNK